MPRPPFWVSTTRTPLCRNGHPFLSFKQNDKRMILETRGDCLHFMTCTQCQTHALGVQSGAHETIQWYDASREQLDEMLAMPHSTRTGVLLEYLGYMGEQSNVA